MLRSLSTYSRCSHSRVIPDSGGGRRQVGRWGHAVDLQEPADGGGGAAGHGGDLGDGQVLVLVKVPEPGRAEDFGPRRRDGQAVGGGGRRAGAGNLAVQPDMLGG
jgi:hypothetical protein